MIAAGEDGHWIAQLRELLPTADDIDAELGKELSQLSLERPDRLKAHSQRRGQARAALRRMAALTWALGRLGEGLARVEEGWWESDRGSATARTTVMHRRE